MRIGQAQCCRLEGASTAVLRAGRSELHVSSFIWLCGLYPERLKFFIGRDKQCRNEAVGEHRYMLR